MHASERVFEGVGVKMRESDNQSEALKEFSEGQLMLDSV